MKNSPVVLFRLAGLIFMYICPTVWLQAQQKDYDIIPLPLPEEVRYFDNQFSSLNTHRKDLYLMAESRVLQKQESRIFRASLKDIRRQMKDSNYVVAYQKLPIEGFESIVYRLYKQGVIVEGLEAMVIKNKTVFFSIEPTTESPYAYLSKGRLLKDRVVIDSNFILPVWKPKTADGKQIYNASFESMEWYKGQLYIFFEHNYFKGNNYVYCFNKHLDADSKDSVSIDRMPYRNSDLKRTGPNDFVAINSFYNGGGKDTINRPEVSDTLHHKLVNEGNGFHNYARLVSLELKHRHFSWQPLFEMPKEWEGFNWEGIADYKKGFFLVNDKYTPAMPYYSKLIYLKPKKGY